MPVFSKGLLCTRGGSGTSRQSRGHRPSCLGGSDEDDGGSSPEVANSSAAVPSPVESSDRTEFETQQSDFADREEFRFLLTLADRQLPLAEAEPEPAPLVEFEHAEMAEEPPPPLLLPEELPLQQQPEPERQPQPKPRKQSTAAKKPPPKVAKSSCGKATSDEGTTTSEEPLESPRLSPAATVQLSAQPLLSAPCDDEEFLVLLTGLLAHAPTPPDDFRFFLTVHQAEAAS